MAGCPTLPNDETKAAASLGTLDWLAVVSSVPSCAISCYHWCRGHDFWREFHAMSRPAAAGRWTSPRPRRAAAASDGAQTPAGTTVQCQPVGRTPAAPALASDLLRPGIRPGCYAGGAQLPTAWGISKSRGSTAAHRLGGFLCGPFCSGRTACELLPTDGGGSVHWHRCPATSIIEGGLQETVTPRCSRLREISNTHEATCTWLTFCSGDGLEVSALMGRSLCIHAWR